MFLNFTLVDLCLLNLNICLKSNIPMILMFYDRLFQKKTIRLPNIFGCGLQSHIELFSWLSVWTVARVSFIHTAQCCRGGHILCYQSVTGDALTCYPFAQTLQQGVSQKLMFCKTFSARFCYFKVIYRRCSSQIVLFNINMWCFDQRHGKCIFILKKLVEKLHIFPITLIETVPPTYI